MHILLVDDEPLVLDTIAPFLERCGHTVLSGNSVADAKAAIGNRDGGIDLLITDVCMPGRDGLHLLRQVREHFPDIDVILITAHSQIGDVREAVEVGAAAFLRKPVKLHELRHLVEQVAASRADRTRIHRLSARLDAERSLRETITRERMFARRLHQRIFPTDFSWLRQTDVAMRHLPQAGLGGDYLDVRPYGTGKALVFVADVSGHGTPAAFGGIALKTWLTSLEPGLSPIDILLRADVVMRDLFPDEFYATAWCAIYEERSRELVYASAGHPPPVVIDPHAGSRSLDAQGAALGIDGSTSRQAATTRLGEDAVLLAYTDGLCDDLADIVGRHLDRTWPTLRDLLTATLDLATVAAPLHAFGDDISLVALRPRQARLAERPVALVGRRVLHIEDDAVTRTILGHALRQMGLEVACASTGAEARTAFAAQRPDLVLLDLVLPDTTGHQLFQDLRLGHPHLPVLVVTGNDLDHATRQCFDFNPAGILTKPVNLGDLRRVVTTALQFDPDRDLVAFDNLGNEWFDFVIASSPTAVELLTRYLQALGRQPLPAHVLDDLVWCIREMAMNGIEWGNRFAPDLRVRVSTLILPDRVMVKIADEGGGFDTHRLFETFDPERESAERDRLGKRVGGFGLAAVQSKMTRVEFNQRGNVVLLVMEFTP